MPTPIRQQAIALLLALISLAPFVAPFARTNEPSAIWHIARLAWWSLVGVGMLALIWMNVVNIAARLFLASVEGTRTALPARGRLLRFLLQGWMVPRRSSDSGARLVRPLGRFSLVVLAGLLGALGALSADALIEIVTNSRIVAPEELNTWGKLVGAVVVFVVLSPLLETLVMAGLFRLLGKVSTDQILLSVVSALAWGLLHAATGHPAQFPSMVWLFWILSMLYLRLRSVHGFREAVTGTCLAHALNNAIALAVIVVGQRFA
ncbi:MAG: CPBP family glutamic-type intramembrane protease [Pseudomonadota bacterium]